MPGANAASMPLTSPVALPAARGDSTRFFVRMAYACAFVAVVGFIPTYWAPIASGSFDGPPILHLHGLLFSAWPFFFIAQARLAASGRFERHRAMGLAGISLATAMLFMGMAVAIYSIDQGIARGFEAQSRAFSIVPITIVLSFAVVVAAAIANVRRPEVHMRLMLVAAISVLPPAIARVLFLVLAPDGAPRPGLGEPPTVAFSLVPTFAANLLIVIAIVHDWRTRGRPHPAYLLAGTGLVALQIVRIPFSSSAAWHSITTWLLRLG